jgi:hypothetical protein
MLGNGVGIAEPSRGPPACRDHQRENLLAALRAATL